MSEGTCACGREMEGTSADGEGANGSSSIPRGGDVGSTIAELTPLRPLEGADVS